MSFFTEVRNMIRKRHKCQFIVGQLANSITKDKLNQFLSNAYI